jgi:hypothetical protein
MGKLVVSFFGFLVVWGIYLLAIDYLLMLMQGLQLVP